MGFEEMWENDDYDNSWEQTERVRSMREDEDLHKRDVTVKSSTDDEDDDFADTPRSSSSRRHKSTPPEHYSISELVSKLGMDTDDLHPALERRVRDFRFAQRKRRETYGNERPWGILGLYDHLAGIRIDLEWAEDAAWRRQHDEPYLSWSDFEKCHSKGHNRPFFTYFLLFVCTIMLIASIGVNDWSVEPLSVNPMIGPSAETLLKLGAKQTDLIVNEGDWYRLISPMVLHAGVIHYLLNMLALWFIGSAVEQSHGFITAAIIFVMSAVGGTILSAIFLPQYISVGASGGIFGLIGACIADLVLNWNLLFLEESERFRHAMVLFWLFIDILLNCLIGLTPFVDNFTHLGGLIYGFLCGLSTIERLSVGFFGLSKIGNWTQVKQNLVRFAGLILSVILIMVTTAVLVSGDGGESPCSGCRYVSCVPMPPWSDNKWWHCDDCDVVSANANKDDPSVPNLFTSLDLTCPNGDLEIIILEEDEQTSDASVIQNRLPSYCREHCESVYN